MIYKLHSGIRTYYLLILTQAFSTVGSKISSLAIGIWIFTETGNAAPLGLVAFFGVLPRVTAAGLGGVLADRYDRRYVMVLADAGQAVGTLLLLISFGSGAFQLWHLYLVTFIQAIFAIFQGPAFAASITMLVPDEHRNRANAIGQLSGSTTSVIAPALAGLIYAVTGVIGAILFDLLTFLVAVVVVLTIHIPRPKQTKAGETARGSIGKELLGGLQFLLKRPPLMILTLHLALMNFLIVGHSPLAVPYILARSGNDKVTLGLILSLSSIGSVAGGLLMTVWRGTRSRIHTIMPGLLAIGSCIIFVGTAQTPLLVGISFTMMSACFPIIVTPLISLYQVKVAPDLQGRVFGFRSQIEMILTPLAFLLGGIVADNVFEPAVNSPEWSLVAPLVGDGVGSGIGLILFIAGVVVVLSSLVVYTLPNIRHMERILPDYVPIT